MSAISDQTHGGAEKARLLLRKAALLQAAQKWEAAHAAYQAAIDIDPGYAAHVEFGRFLAKTDRQEEATEQFMQVFIAAQRSGNIQLKAVACNNLAAVLRETGYAALAARMQQLSLESETEIGSGTLTPRQYSCDLTNLANDAIVLGRFELAEQLVRRSLRQEVTWGTLQGQAADWGTLGVLALSQDKPADALGRFWMAFQLHRSVGDQRGQGCDLLNLAEVCHAMSRHQAAIRMLRRARALFQSAHAVKMACHAENRLSDAARIAEVLTRNSELN